MINPKVALAISFLIILSTHFFYYPKWKKSGTEATLSWDVSGYYYYLPAYLIYENPQKLEWKDQIQSKYNPASSLYQAFEYKEDVFVMKYSAGMAVQYLPFFSIAHILAKIGPWESDGFSFPYQLMISLGSLLVSLLGLYVLMKFLLNYFDAKVVGATLLILVLGTNYLNYSAIDGAMTHNYLFTLYALLLWSSLKFYTKPSIRWAALIGLLLGVSALTRPTEVIIGLIPLLWGVVNLETFKHRIQFIKSHFHHYLIAVLCMFAIGFIQLLYWKSITGEWIVYSYQDQGFSWLHPHLKDGLISYKKGWLVYTPMMLFALVGFRWIYQHKKELFLPIFITSMLIIYITFSWDIWWYGGSLGQRAMVQSYALLAIPLAGSLTWIHRAASQTWKIIWIGIITIFSYYNIWLTHQAHKGGLLDPENMTKAYFWKVLGKYDQPIEVKKFLDTDEEWTGERKNVNEIFTTDFERDSLAQICTEQPISGNQSLCLDGNLEYSPIYSFDLNPDQAEWVRAYAKIKAPFKEWDVWKMSQMILRFYKGDRQVKQKYIRLHRLIHDGQIKEVFLDATCPLEPFDRVELLFWNGGSQKTMIIDDVTVETFDS